MYFEIAKIANIAGDALRNEHAKNEFNLFWLLEIDLCPKSYILL
jgi:hypothetical protein